MAFRARKPTLLILFALIAVLALTSTLWLSAIGSYLVQADQPAHADYAVVLAGDSSRGHRLLAAAELVRQGMVRKAIVDGPLGSYDVHESDLAVNWAVKRGYPEDYFLKLPMTATSTRAEAVVVVAELRRLGAHSFLLVTSDYHTRRAGRYFRQISDGLEMKVIAAPDDNFRSDSWWRTREGQKTVYLEWSKTIAGWFGI